MSTRSLIDNLPETMQADVKRGEERYGFLALIDEGDIITLKEKVKRACENGGMPTYYSLVICKALSETEGRQDLILTKK